MLSEHDFDDIVAGFYRAASGVVGWVEALVPFQRVVGGPGSSPMNRAEMATCIRLARHLTNALALHRVRIDESNQGRLGTALLSRLRAPIVLVDDQRRLQYANPAARELLATCSAVVERDGRLYCSRSQDDSALVIGLRQLLGVDGSRVGSPDTDKVYLRARATVDHTVLGLYVYALRPAETLHSFGEQALAMLVFHDPTQRIEIDPFVVAAAFELTPGEARVAAATALGVSPENLARQHAVSINTVRSQLRAIFAKTGTTRQAELVSLLAALPMALLGFDPP